MICFCSIESDIGPSVNDTQGLLVPELLRNDEGDGVRGDMNFRLIFIFELDARMVYSLHSTYHIGVMPFSTIVHCHCLSCNMDQ